MGSSIFLRASNRDIRLKVWNTNPIFFPLILASSISESVEVSKLSIKYVPLVGLSRQPIRFINVVLPLPEGPMMATNSPGSMDMLMSFSTGTASFPS